MISLLLLLIFTLVSATPAPQRRSVAIIPIPSRSGLREGAGKVFDKKAALDDQARVQSRYGNIHSKTAAGSAIATKNAKRFTMRSSPYDVSRLNKRNGDSGIEPLTDYYDTIDERERGNTFTHAPQAYSLDLCSVLRSTIQCVLDTPYLESSSHLVTSYLGPLVGTPPQVRVHFSLHDGRPTDIPEIGHTS